MLIPLLIATTALAGVVLVRWRRHRREQALRARISDVVH